MANVTDAFINALSGSDPQNLMEYITRQKIYDSRFWKEECFGLSVADVLEKAAQKLQCIGGLPTKFLALALKLLQVHPETELVIESFIQQEEFKYVRALGCFYVRMTGSPPDIYEALEPLYRDRRKLRVWSAASQEWSILHMDEYIHQLLDPKNNILGLALPRLPQRRALQEAGYLAEGPRPTALIDKLEAHGNDPIAYLNYKATTQKSAAAQEAWEKRQSRLGLSKGNDEKSDHPEEREPKEKRKQHDSLVDKKERKKQKVYDSLFKKSSGKTKEAEIAEVSNTSAKNTVEFSGEQWNAERAKLGLKPLKR
ncbi:pre-mRNA-splicing factor 38A [Fistulifera solaris]|jgi:pre-mRNA-splicing factor 38A|uniref:Pre-mRNA-splicing factor 38 n=1 Tax=Fistulifera solaris TaxID=1519565 RepID=A0A1Z5JB71_FISSO|nr:pre-mRNA-splicing factor 38A [Fistulifera solaris]|eukprot:GAX11206.1 pre-mRNA-splicing factor 38A [Fistulifera solaris]